MRTIVSFSCRNCGQPIHISRDNEPNVCTTAWCADHMVVGKLTLLEELEKQVAENERIYGATYDALDVARALLR